MADSEGDACLSRHKELAERWIWVFYLTGAIGAIGVWIGWKWPKALSTLALALVVSTLASLILGGVIAESGGKIRHPEFRGGHSETSKSKINKT